MPSLTARSCLCVLQLVLSACSSYFEHLFTMHPDKAPLVILKDIKYEDIKAIVEFMYQGEINISQVGDRRSVSGRPPPPARRTQPTPPRAVAPPQPGPGSHAAGSLGFCRDELRRKMLHAFMKRRKWRLHHPICGRCARPIFVIIPRLMQIERCACLAGVQFWRGASDPVYMSRKIRKFRTDKFDT